MIHIKKITFENKIEMQKCFEIRKDVFVNEQQCDPKDEYEFEEESTHYLLSEKNISGIAMGLISCNYKCNS